MLSSNIDWLIIHVVILQKLVRMRAHMPCPWRLKIFFSKLKNFTLLIWDVRTIYAVIMFCWSSVWPTLLKRSKTNMGQHGGVTVTMVLMSVHPLINGALKRNFERTCLQICPQKHDSNQIIKPKKPRQGRLVGGKSLSLNVLPKLVAVLLGQLVWSWQHVKEDNVWEANGSFHPYVRYSATLIQGNLFLGCIFYLFLFIQNGDGGPYNFLDLWGKKNPSLVAQP